jgi:hypothetical protein
LRKPWKMIFSESLVYTRTSCMCDMKQKKINFWSFCILIYLHLMCFEQDMLLCNQRFIHKSLYSGLCHHILWPVVANV